MRPWKRTVFLPAWARKERLPAERRRLHFFPLRFFRVGARHLRPTLRPGLTAKKRSRTGAARLREKVILVPTGDLLFFLENRASLRPSRQVLGCNRRARTAGRASVVKLASRPEAVS